MIQGLLGLNPGDKNLIHATISKKNIYQISGHVTL